MDFFHRGGAVFWLQDMKAAPVVNEIDEVIFYRNFSDVPGLEVSEEPGVGSVFAREDHGGWADVDPDDIEPMLDQKYGIMSRTCSDIQSLADWDDR